jgi:tRNA A-37 threonylcarbamoyl transferase component Bud32
MHYSKDIIINATWQLTPGYSTLSDIFGSLDAVFALTGKKITTEVIRVEHEGVHYYVKRYHEAGKGLLRKYFGTPRIKNEWQNLQWFEKWGINTAPVVGYGMQTAFGGFVRGAMITREIPDSTDLRQLVRENDARLKSKDWVNNVSKQLAQITRTLHDHRFIHNDLKWRNILVDNHDRIYLIDCPLGGFWRGRLLKHRIIKDFATLDRVAKSKLSRTQRLRFYLQYAGHAYLTQADKEFLTRLLNRKIRRIRHDKEGH